MIGLVGEVGLFVIVKTVGLGVSTLIGAMAAPLGRTGSTDGLMTPMVVVDTVGMGWIPTAGVALKTGKFAVEANEIPGKATLNRGSASAGAPGGGERLSGDALGGVMGV